MIDVNKVQEYESLIDDPNCNENKIQDFLEKNTMFIPKRFMENHGISGNVIISKLQLGTKYETDFAFVSKCTNYWNVVLIEIEKPNKNIFNKEDNFSAEYTHAKGQINLWKESIEQDSSLKESVLKSLDNLFFPISMKNNPINFKYVLVYGRSNEINNEQRKLRFNQENNRDSDISVVTYDRLKTCWENQAYSNAIIANIKKGNKLIIKNIPECDFDTSLFAYISPSKIEISRKQIEMLKRYGYEMEEWLNNFSLYINNKQASLNNLITNPKNVFCEKRRFDD